MEMNYQTDISEIELQQRMNDYPPQLSRLSNIIENRPEGRFYFSLEKVFFNLFETNLWSIIIVFGLFFSLVYGNFKIIKK